VRTGRLFAAAPVVTVATFALPIAAGFVGTLAPAFGYLPAIGGHEFSLSRGASWSRGRASHRACG